ncbi:histidine-type phosphatase [Paraburkholderia saeva]|uniref:histidine-type phosphatase n=1 Tax=Paraburkholderia saeva TaxID=2777537 RepID=UPI001D1EA199|nr:histidine-type phosphatase [Paraburkholderia saeva]CAG4887491.1 Periplasmic AppA protein [Paraburkholderia saeva]
MSKQTAPTDPVLPTDNGQSGIPPEHPAAASRILCARPVTRRAGAFIYRCGVAVALTATLGMAACTAPLTAARAPGADAQGGQPWQLESVVIVSRHGVRSPTHTRPPLAQLSSQSWPTWPVQPGQLTERGAALVEQMGRYYGAWLREQHVLPTGTCPAPGQVYGWADVDQRTRLTGDALLRGIAPDCGLGAAHEASLDKADPLFHSTESGVCPLDPQRARKAIDARLGSGGLSGLSSTYAATLGRMSEVLQFTASPLCPASAQPGQCRFEALQNRVEIDADGRHMRLDGPLGIASTVSEVFLLEHAQGFPADQVAWGRISDAADWHRLLQAHNAQFDLMAKTPYLAQRKGTPLLADVTAALEQNDAATHAPAGNRVYVLGAHDTNLANLAGMLQLDWMLPDQPDNTPPGGALVFSRWRDPASATDYVTVELVYQSLEQLRDQTALSIAVPPGHVSLPVPGCQDPAHQNACRLQDFSRVVKQVLAPDCIGRP